MIERLAGLLKDRFGRAPRLYIRTYGCQQNVADSQRIRGLMHLYGYEDAADENSADVIVFNTCAVREHAEDRVFGNIGNLKNLKRQRPEAIVAIGGCMVQQQTVADTIRASYPYVDVVFNTNRISALPEQILDLIEKGKRQIVPACDRYTLNEDAPVLRDGESLRAFIPIMYGCDNFCTYCIVPYVRGRERSRSPEAIEKEFRECVAQGYKDIMLLGQNVNSYGKGLEEDINFPKLLRRLNAVEGDFVIRFMTSHPKNATKELFDAIADCEKVERHIHLPVQCGSDRVLKAMNRHYTVKEYLGLLDYARSVVPDLYVTSDIIVGFPGETLEEYEETVDLIRRAGFYAIFSFIYSKRPGTPAAEMPDDTPHGVKADRLNALNEVQRLVTAEIEERQIGHRYRGLCIGSAGEGKSVVRLSSNGEVTADGTWPVNEFCTVEVTDYKNRRLYGRIVENA